MGIAWWRQRPGKLEECGRVRVGVRVRVRVGVRD